MVEALLKFFRVPDFFKDRSAYKEYLPFAYEPIIVRFGEMAFGYATWGQYQSIEDYKQIHNNELTSMDKKNLNRLGFDGGYRYPPETDVLSPEIQEQQATHAAMFVERLMKERSWKGIDHLAVGSTTTTLETLRTIPKILKKKGLTVESMKMHLLACTSMTDALMSAAADEHLKGKKAVVVGFDSLSGAKVRPDDHLTINLFGNTISGAAFRPYDEIESINGHTYIERDEFGVVRMPRMYSLPKGGHLKIPERYLVNNNANGVFAVTSEGVFLGMPESAEFAEVHGKENFDSFHSRTPPLVIKELDESYFGPKKQGREVNPIFFHQANKLILTAIAYEINEYCKINSIPFNLKSDAPWLMEGIGLCNSSAGTLLAGVTKAILDGRLRPNLLTGLVGMGVGSAISPNVMILRG